MPVRPPIALLLSKSAVPRVTQTSHVADIGTVLQPGMPPLQVCKAKFSTTQHVPLETAVAAPRATIDPAMYVPPALRYGSAGTCFRRVSHPKWSLRSHFHGHCTTAQVFILHWAFARPAPDKLHVYVHLASM